MRKVVAGLLLGAGSALIVLLLAWTKLGGLDRLDLQLYDWSLRRLANPAVGQSTTSFSSRSTMRAFATTRDAVGRWPWPRVLQSNLIDFLQRAPARVIAYDIQLSERSQRQLQVWRRHRGRPRSQTRDGVVDAHGRKRHPAGRRDQSRHDRQRLAAATAAHRGAVPISWVRSSKSGRSITAAVSGS